MRNTNNSINYIEFPLVKNAETKQFYTQVFGWEFTDWGPNYVSFSGAGIDGGFNGGDDARVSVPGVLVVLYTDDLPQKLKDVQKVGGQIIKPIFNFRADRDSTFWIPTALN